MKKQLQWAPVKSKTPLLQNETRQNVSIGVLGTGSIGTKHLKLLKEHGAHVWAVPKREARFQELLDQGCPCVRDLKELKKTGASTVVIATETSNHFRDIQEALDLGFKVVVEKPLAPSVSSLSRLIKQPEKSSSQIFVACCLRFDEGLRLIPSLLSKIGTPHLIEIECRSYLPDWRPERDHRELYSAKKEGGGVLLDLIHEIDYMLWLFGYPKKVSADLVNTGRLGIESPEQGWAHFYFENGLAVSMYLDYLTRQSKRKLRISADQGEIEYDLLKRKIKGVMQGSPKEIELETPFSKMYDSQTIEIIEFASGTPPRSLASFRDGIAALALCDAWTQSSLCECRKREVHL